MNYKNALEILESLLDAIEKKEDQKIIATRYGAAEEIIHRFGGIAKVEIPQGFGVTSTYPNYIEAGYLSNRTTHRLEGRNQLLKIIGKVRQLANDPTLPKIEFSITQTIQILRRFRECCQYNTNPPHDEKDTQDIIWIMLRSQYDRLSREDTLPRFGAKNYKPDFGIPDINTLIEVKFIGEKTKVPDIQEEILADIPGYLNEATEYDNLIVFVYDASHKLKDSGKFIDDIKGIEGISEVIVTPGF